MSKSILDALETGDIVTISGVHKAGQPVFYAGIYKRQKAPMGAEHYVASYMHGLSGSMIRLQLIPIDEMLRWDVQVIGKAPSMREVASVHG